MAGKAQMTKDECQRWIGHCWATVYGNGSVSMYGEVNEQECRHCGVIRNKVWVITEGPAILLDKQD